MKLTTFVSTLALGAVLTVPAMQASGAFIPPPSDNIQIKLNDANAVYYLDDTGNWKPRPRGPIDPLASAAKGDQDLFVFYVTDIFDLNQTGPAADVAPSTSVGGIFTFLEVADDPIFSATTVNVAGIDLPTSLTLTLVDSSRPHTTSPNANSYGRFFLYQNDSFAFASNFNDFGLTPDMIQFDQVQDGYNIDLAGPLTDGTLLATGSLLSTQFPIGGIELNYRLQVDSFDNPTTAFYKAEITGKIELDGGLWFDLEVVSEMIYTANLFLYLDETIFPRFLPDPGDGSAWNQGWVGSSTDPISFIASTPIPEPVSVGLAGLGILAATGAATRRRR